MRGGNRRADRPDAHAADAPPTAQSRPAVGDRQRAFAGVDDAAFTALIARMADRKEDCLFVAVPDVVASARRTLEVFDWWAPRLAGWKICQDGQEALPIRWERIDAVFIGGSASWKCSPAAAQIAQAAKMLRKWVRIGHVNSPGRRKHFEAPCADSADGTGIARYSHMRRAISDRDQQMELV